MTEAEALARLTAMVSPDEDPVLSSDELQILLDDHHVVDVNGLGPDSSGYTPTWGLRAAAAEGWRWKAGKVASRYDFSSDVHSHKRDQLQKHCLEMAKTFSRGVSGSIAVHSRDAGYDPVIRNLNGGA